MPKRFNLLILGPDSEIGQSIIKNINDHFHFLNIAVPTGLYSDGIILPPNQIVLHQSSQKQLAEDFSIFEVVVSCSSQFSVDSVRDAAKEASAKYVDALYSYPQTIIEAAYNRMPFVPTHMEADQSASGLSIPDIWNLSHMPSPLPSPTKLDGKYVIEQETVSLDEISVVHRIQFTGPFYAYFFYFFSILLRFIFPFFRVRRGYSSVCRWGFSGKCLEHHQEYNFKASVDKIDAEGLRPDLALMKILQNLGISKSLSHDWGFCKHMKIKLTEYTIVK